MSKDRLEGNWKQLRGLVREQWEKLTDDELDRIEGRRERLHSKIQEHYGLTKEKAKEQVDDFLEIFDEEELPYRRSSRH